MNKRGLALLALCGAAAWWYWRRSGGGEGYLIDAEVYSNRGRGLMDVAYSVASGDFEDFNFMGNPNADRQISTTYLPYLKRAENSLKKGWNGSLWYPHVDSAGYATIAYGHKILPSDDFSGGITDAEATGLLMLDVGKHTAPAQRVTVALTQPQFDAIVDFIYNAGEGSFNGSGRFAKSIKNNPLNAFNTQGIDAGFAAMRRHYDEVVKLPKLAKSKNGLLNRSSFQQRMAYQGVYG